MDGVKDLPDSLLAWICSTALVLSHLAFVDTCVLGKLAGVDEVEVIEE